MLGEMLKKRVEEEKQEKQNKISKENAALREKQLKQLEDLQTIIATIKEQIVKIANGETDKLKQNSLGIYVTDVEKMTLNSSYDFHHQYAEKDFFESFNKFGFHAEMNEFKKWLKDNEIKGINTMSQHDGGGLRSWVEFYVKI